MEGTTEVTEVSHEIPRRLSKESLEAYAEEAKQLFEDFRQAGAVPVKRLLGGEASALELPLPEDVEIGPETERMLQLVAPEDGGGF